jgi:hypothetical protein
LLFDTKHVIEAGSELEVKYSIVENERVAISIKVKEPRLVEEVEAVLNHESLRAFHGVITLVEIDASLEKALGVVIATRSFSTIEYFTSSSLPASITCLVSNSN